MKSLALALLLLPAACATAPVEVSRVVSPTEASRAQGTKLRAVAVLRGEGRAELPDGAIVEATRVRVPQPGQFEYALDDGEKVLRDEKGAVTGVQTPGEPPVVTSFKPGAVYDEEQKVVRGELALGEQLLPLLPTDRVEVRGAFVSGEEIPLGGRVEKRRSTSALVFGLLMFSAAYVPSVYVAASSPQSYDGALYAPIVGPWLAYSSRPDCVESVGVTCAGFGLQKFGLAFDGVAQALGLAIFAVGLPTRTEVDWTGSTQAKSSVRVRPLVGAGRVGLTGEF